MKFYPFGTAPDLPGWFTRELSGTELAAERLPMWFIGTQLDLSAPAAYRLTMPPNWVLCRHGHPCERLEIVVQGSLEVGDGRIARPGDTFTAAANTLYGPHRAGPEGCTTIEIFSAVEGMFRMLYEGPDGSLLEADVRKGELPPDYQPKL